MFYNKTLLDELGITIEDNMSLDDFVAISKEVYEKSGYRANLYHYGLYMDMYARANDIQATDKLGGDSAEDYVPYFQTLEDGIKEGWHISPSQAADTASVEEDPMVYGSSPENMTWCTINGSAQLTAYQAAAPEGTDPHAASEPAAIIPVIAKTAAFFKYLFFNFFSSVYLGCILVFVDALIISEFFSNEHSET